MSAPEDGSFLQEVSAGGVVVREIDGRPHVLLILDPYGKWGLPKGHLEGAESEREAAVREVREETGLDSVEMGPPVETIHWTFQREGVRVEKRCTFFLMRSESGEIRPEVTEGITDCAWLDLDEAVERVDYENTRSVIRSAGEMLTGVEAEGGTAA